MPTIRPYQSQVAPEGGLPSRQASGSDFGSTGLQHLGQAVSGAGQDLARGIAIEVHEAKIAQEKIDLQKRQASHIEVQRVISDAQLAAQQQEIERRKYLNPANPDEHVAGAIAFGKDQTEATINAAIENPASPILPEDYAKIRLGLGENTNRVILSASQFSADSNAAYQVKQVSTVYETALKIVLVDPTQLSEQLQRNQVLVGGLRTLSEAKRTELLNNMRQGLTDSAMNGMVDQAKALNNVDNTGQVREQLTMLDSYFKNNASPAAFATALDRLDAMQHNQAGQMNQLHTERMNEEIRQAASGVLNKLTINAAAFLTDPGARGVAEKRILDANLEGAAVRFANKASASELAEGRAAAYALTQDPNTSDYDGAVAIYNAISRVAHSRGEAIRDNLAGVVLLNETVLAAYRKIDPSEPDTRTDYVRKYRAERERIAPQRADEFLPAEQVEQVHLVMTTGTADDKADRLRELASQWGEHWPTVLHQLVDKKALDPIQGAVGRLAMDPKNAVTVRDLLLSAELSAKDRQALAPTIRNDIDLALTRQLMPVQLATNSQEQGYTAFANLRTAIQALAEYRSFRNPGVPTAKIVEDAANEVIMKDFHWNGSWFSPKGVDPDVFKRGMSNARANDRPFALTATDPSKPHLVVPESLAGLSPANQERAVRDQLHNSEYANSNGASGLTRIWSDGNTMMIRDTDGTVRPWTYTWDELEKWAGMQAPPKAAPQAAPRPHPSGSTVPTGPKNTADGLIGQMRKLLDESSELRAQEEASFNAAMFGARNKP